jgi:hypothetical protein
MQAAGLDHAHLQYRETWMSPTATAGLPEDEVKERIHAVIKNLDPTFDLPDTAEGIETLTHVRTREDWEPVLAWLGNAKQFEVHQQPGWCTPSPPSARAAADAWQRVRFSLRKPVLATCQVLTAVAEFCSGVSSRKPSSAVHSLGRI